MFHFTFRQRRTEGCTLDLICSYGKEMTFPCRALLVVFCFFVFSYPPQPPQTFPSAPLVDEKRRWTPPKRFLSQLKPPSHQLSHRFEVVRSIFFLSFLPFVVDLCLSTFSPVLSLRSTRVVGLDEAMNLERVVGKCCTTGFFFFSPLCNLESWMERFVNP